MEERRWRGVEGREGEARGLSMVDEIDPWLCSPWQAWLFHMGSWLKRLSGEPS